MKRILQLIILFTLTYTTGFGQTTSEKGTYTLVVEGFDWGAAASKLILTTADSLDRANRMDYKVHVKRKSDCMPADAPYAEGDREVIGAYVSDAEGNHSGEGNFITLLLAVGPHIAVGSPIQYFTGEGCRGNQWVDYEVSVTNTASGNTWNQETNRIIPLVDQFDLSGKYKHNEINLSYAAFTPENTETKRPLLVWLHGGGEGGTDPSIVLLANRAANYAAPEIQEIFGGAYVLAPQSPTFWMQSESGEYTRGNTEDIYNKAVMALIRDYVSKTPNIDTNRIYVGGCSNGGYLTQKLLLTNPDYFAAAFPSALAYSAEFLSEEDVASLAGQSIWYIHSADDPVTRPEVTVLPTIEKLKQAGAENVHFTYYEHVIDLYGLLGGEDYHFNGHWSWVYSHRNHPKLVIDGEEITVMEWLSKQSKD